MSKSVRRRRAFTLVELLVVIGIIAVLIGILLPALSRARDAANQTACMSTLKQLGNCIAMYQVDFKGSYPYGRYIVNTPSAVSQSADSGQDTPANRATLAKQDGVNEQQELGVNHWVILFNKWIKDTYVPPPPCTESCGGTGK